MRSLTLKLSLLFVLVSVVAVLVVAIWVGQRVEDEFSAYCTRACIADGCEASMSGMGEGPQAGAAIAGALELAYLDAIRNALLQAAIVAGLAGLLLALLFSRVITNPINRLKTSVQRPHCTQSQREGNFKSSAARPRLTMRKMNRGSNTLRSPATGQALLHSPQVKHIDMSAALAACRNGSLLLKEHCEEMLAAESGIGVSSQECHRASLIGPSSPCRQ